MAGPIIVEGCTGGGRCFGCDIYLSSRSLLPDDQILKILIKLCNLRANGPKIFYSRKEKSGSTPASPPPPATRCK